MDRVNKILKNENFKKYLKKNKKCEKNRVFCKHNLQHMLDTARIAYIINLENGLNIDKEVIYAAALLHDIGRWMQYEKNIPHEEASVQLASPILQECGFSEKESQDIANSIYFHRDKEEKTEGLRNIIALSDKLSRNCLYCKSAAECNWSNDKKNNYLQF